MNMASYHSILCSHFTVGTTHTLKTMCHRRWSKKLITNKTRPTQEKKQFLNVSRAPKRSTTLFEDRNFNDFLKFVLPIHTNCHNVWLWTKQTQRQRKTPTTMPIRSRIFEHMIALLRVFSRSVIHFISRLPIMRRTFSPVCVLYWNR